MNGKIMLNGKAYSSSGRPSREITMAQWLALPDTKYTDGIVYYIKDIGGANQFPPLIYSDEEREIGVWRDGRPLYQRTYRLSPEVNLVSNQWVSINDIDLTDIETVTNVECLNYWATIHSFDASYTEQSGKLALLNTRAYDIEAGIVTIQYTKTSDIPGSGTWTTDGTYAHHYSTSEKVVGTWIDGKPLYEKTIHETISSTTQWIDTGVNSTDSILFAKGCLIQNNAITLLGNSDPSALAGIGTLIPDIVTSGKWSLLYRTSGASLNSGEIYITLQYTKTTD